MSISPSHSSTRARQSCSTDLAAALPLAEASSSNAHIPRSVSPRSGSAAPLATYTAPSRSMDMSTGAFQAEGAAQPVASSSRRSFPSLSTSTSSSTPSSSSPSISHHRSSFQTEASTAPTSSGTGARIPAAPARNWRPTTNVPAYIHQRHAMRATSNGMDEDGERNRWLSEDEGIGASTMSGRRRRRSWDRGGPDRSDPPGGHGNDGGHGGRAGVMDIGAVLAPAPAHQLAANLASELDQDHTRRKSDGVHRRRTRDSSKTRRSHRTHKTGDPGNLAATNAPAGSSRGTVRRTHSYEPSTSSGTPDPAPSTQAAITLAQPQRVGDVPPRIADLISPRSPVVMTHSMSMTPAGTSAPSTGEATVPAGEQEATGVGKLAERSNTGFARRSISGGTDESDDSMGGAGDATEWQRQKARKGTVAKLQTLLGCILCPPDISGKVRPLHNPLTLPCGHTLSASHLVLPVHHMLAPSSPPAIDQAGVAAASHARRLQQQRLQHWTGLACPIPTCKRFAPSACLPGTAGLQADIPEITIRLPPAHSPHPSPDPSHNAQTQEARHAMLASGVHYYPPQAPPAGESSPSPPAYGEREPVAPTSTTIPPVDPADTGPVEPRHSISSASGGDDHTHDHHSPLQDVTVEKILLLVQQEHMRLTRPREVKLAKPDSAGLTATLRQSQIDPPSSATPFSVGAGANAVRSTRVSVASESSSIQSPVSASGSDNSLASQSLAPKRPRNTPPGATSLHPAANTGATSAESNPSPYDWEFQREMMAVLECDVCALLLYEPVTTPCQHSFCAKCLSRSLDHSSRCPVCRQDLPSFAFFQDPPINRVLSSVIKTVFPSEYVDRGAALDRDERDARLDTPIFVCTLAFPGMPTILHVFEPRYRLMIRRCIESPSPRFGMVLPSRPGQGNMAGVNEYGTMLEIQSVQMLPDGRSMVETVGTHRFKLLEKGNLDGYTVGRIERIDDIGPEEEAARQNEAVAAAHVVRDQFRQAYAEQAHAAHRASGAASTNDGALPLPTVQQAIALSIPSVLPGQPSAIPLTPAVEAVRTEDAAQTTEEYMTICRAFIEQLRSGSAPWLLQRLNNTYGHMPDDPSEFSYWMALVMPIDEYEKARLLPIRSPRLRLKLIAHWVESMRGAWWFRTGCIVG